MTRHWRQSLLWRAAPSSGPRCKSYCTAGVLLLAIPPGDRLDACADPQDLERLEALVSGASPRPEGQANPSPTTALATTHGESSSPGSEGAAGVAAGVASGEVCLYSAVQEAFAELQRMKPAFVENTRGEQTTADGVVANGGGRVRQVPHAPRDTLGLTRHEMYLRVFLPPCDEVEGPVSASHSWCKLFMTADAAAAVGPTDPASQPRTA
jgi:hypothetical protein